MPRCRPKPVECEFHVWDGTHAGFLAIESELPLCTALRFTLAPRRQDCRMYAYIDGQCLRVAAGYPIIFEGATPITILTPAEFAEKYEVVE